MSKIKHIFMLFLKLAVIFVVFALTSATAPLQALITDSLGSKDTAQDFKVETETKNGAAVTYEAVDGKLVFDITQSGDSYDDVKVCLLLDGVSHDSTLARFLLGSAPVDNEHSELLQKAENGPWHATFSFALVGDSIFSFKSGSYTVIDDAENEYVSGVSSSLFIKRSKTEVAEVQKNDPLSLTLIFGDKEAGALKSGKYALHLDSEIQNTEGELLGLSIGELLLSVGRTMLLAVKQNGIGIFTQVNWIAFYCIFVIIGSFVYMWRDLRAAFGVIGACCGAGVAEILKEVYIHGMYLGSDEDRRCSLLRAIPVSVAIWLLLTLTVPLRMLLYIIRDIVCLFRNDPMLDNYSYPGNIMGSIGILFILYGVTGIISSSGAEGYVIIAVGAVVCIIAHMLCKVREYA